MINFLHNYIILLKISSFNLKIHQKYPYYITTGIEWTYMLYLAIICSVFGFTLQPYAQSGTTAERASVLCALNPITVAVLGAVFLGETLTLKGIIGAMLIIASIVV